MKSLLILLGSVAIATAIQISFSRTLNCTQNNTVKCTKWQQTTSIAYQSFWSSFCFSENTHVLTRDGPKSMKQLKIFDQILSYDPETGKQGFSKVLAWLHRDTFAFAQFNSIKTKENMTFEASAYHNIAAVNQQGKIDFKLVKDLQEGDELIGFPQSNPSVLNVNSTQEKRGLYSPFTEVGNYYIFSTTFEARSYSKTDSMILVHSLSQVKDPISEFGIAKEIVEFGQYLGWGKQPRDQQIYIHPLYSYLHFVFGANWLPVQQEARYYLEPLQKQNSLHLTHEQRLISRSSSTPAFRPSYTPSFRPTYTPSFRPSYSPTFQPTYYPSFTPSYSPSYYPSYSPSYSSPFGYQSSSAPLFAGGAFVGTGAYSSSRRRRERANEITSLGMFISILQEIYLF